MSDLVGFAIIVIGVVFVLFAAIVVFETLKYRKAGALVILVILILLFLAAEKTKPGILKYVLETLTKAVFPNRPNLFIGH